MKKITKEQVLKALIIIDQFKTQSEKEILEINKIIEDPRPIEILNLQSRELNCLNAAEIYCIGDLLNSSQKDLCKIRNLSEKGVAKIEIAMNKISLSIPIY